MVLGQGVVEANVVLGIIKETKKLCTDVNKKTLLLWLIVETPCRNFAQHAGGQRIHRLHPKHQQMFVIRF